MAERGGPTRLDQAMKDFLVDLQNGNLSDADCNANPNG